MNAKQAYIIANWHTIMERRLEADRLESQRIKEEMQNKTKESLQDIIGSHNVPALYL